jgi:pyruvate,orthophosphate dikinase
MTTYAYDFAEGSREQADLLGGKGAGLAEMTRMGLPVPPGFTISAEACRAYLATGNEPEGLARQITERLAALEHRMGRRLATRTTRCCSRCAPGADSPYPG